MSTYQDGYRAGVQDTLEKVNDIFEKCYDNVDALYEEIYELLLGSNLQ